MAKSTRVTLHHVGWGEGGEWEQAYAYFDRAWGNVLANLRKRFESGPIDWSDWMARCSRCIRSRHAELNPVRAELVEAPLRHARGPFDGLRANGGIRPPSDRAGSSRPPPAPARSTSQGSTLASVSCSV